MGAFAICLWFVSPFLAGHIAGNRGGKAWFWFVVGLFLGPLAIVLALVANGKSCPECRSSIHEKARKCPKCGSEIVSPGGKA